jgi:uncharacterized protein
MNAKKLILALVIAAAASFGMAQTVIVDHKPVSFDVPVKMVAGTLMVPVRNICDAMGADMRWRMDKGVLECMRNGTKVEIEVGNRRARVNDLRKDMDEASYIHRGRTYVPLKFLAEAMGYIISMENGDIVLQPVKH